MRRIIRNLPAAIIATTAIACDNNDRGPEITTAPLTLGAGPTCGDTTTTLIAGRHHEAGAVTIHNAADAVIVAIESNDSWAVETVHVHVGVGAMSSTAPGSFGWQTSFEVPVTDHVVTVPLADIAGAACGETLTIAVHTVSVRLDANGNVVQSETGWAFGEAFSGARWGWSVNYLFCCDFEDAGNGDDTSGDDTNGNGDDTNGNGDDTNNTGDDTNNTGDDSNGDDTNGNGDDTNNTNNTGDDTNGNGDDTNGNGDDTNNTGDDTNDTNNTGDDTNNTGDNTNDTNNTGDDNNGNGDDTNDTGDDTNGNGDDNNDTGDDNNNTGDNGATTDGGGPTTLDVSDLAPFDGLVALGSGCSGGSEESAGWLAGIVFGLLAVLRRSRRGLTA